MDALLNEFINCGVILLYSIYFFPIEDAYNNSFTVWSRFNWCNSSWAFNVYVWFIIALTFPVLISLTYIPSFCLRGIAFRLSNISISNGGTYDVGPSIKYLSPGFLTSD